ncbi:MAG: L,D-transpeptidase family protein [Rhodobacteraceae bacterium]|nr:L,D-transpeptidase family protein [Paracoccaceae bacterium]
MNDAAPKRVSFLKNAVCAASFAALASLAAPVWAAQGPEVSETTGQPETPLQMIVSIKQQKIDVYRGTQLLQSSPISTGKRGHSTPTGVFSILEKRKRHFSNLYNSAPMPYMQRLTWSGIALHQGRLPGYPASHGCIRMPMSFAKELYGLTERGLHVVVAKDEAVPTLIRHAVLPQPAPHTGSVASLDVSAGEGGALRGSLDAPTVNETLVKATEPNPNFNKPIRIIVSPRNQLNGTRTVQSMLKDLELKPGPVDGVLGKKTRAAIERFQLSANLPVTGELSHQGLNELYVAAGRDIPQNATLRVRRNFKDIYEAPVTLMNPKAPIGTHVFTALGFAEGDTSVEWMAVPAEGEEDGTPLEALDRLRLSDKVRHDLSEILTPGSSLIVTDRSYLRNTGLGTDFVVVTR